MRWHLHVIKTPVSQNPEGMICFMEGKESNDYTTMQEYNIVLILCITNALSVSNSLI